MSTFRPTPRLCKILFGRARHCAFERRCRRPLIAEHRALLSVNAQIAHIRSGSPGGPRFDPGYDPLLIDTEENLVLFCLEHHAWVDEHPDAYTAEELLVWKKAQVAQAAEGGGLVLTDDLVQQIIAALTTPKAGIELIGVILDGRGGRTEVPLQALAGTRFLNAPETGRYLGARVINSGAVAFDVDAVGIDLDLGAEAPGSYQFLVGDPLVCPPSRVVPQSNGVWLADILTIGAGIREVMAGTLYVPSRVRAYAHLGGGGRPVGPWLPAVHLPVWDEGMTQERLEELRRLGQEERRRRGETDHLPGEPTQGSG